MASFTLSKTTTKIIRIQLIARNTSKAFRKSNIVKGPKYRKRTLMGSYNIFLYCSTNIVSNHIHVI